MTEEQIRDGYDRLGGALAPPLDALERVDRRMRARRRGRRAAVVGGTALALAAIAGSAVALAGGEDGSETVAVDQPAPVSTLTMSRPDGSTYAFSDVTVSCAPPPGTEGNTMGTAGRIWLTSPMPEDVASDGARPDRPFVYFEGIVSELQGDPTFRLPVTGPGDSSTYPLTFFVGDTVGTSRPNEVSSAEYESTGAVRVLDASCEPVPTLHLEVAATLGSEVRQQSLRVVGAVR